MPVVQFVKQQRSVECPVGTNLRRLALDNGIDLYVFPNNIVNCRGNGLCGTCRVQVDNPRTPSRARRAATNASAAGRATSTASPARPRCSATSRWSPTHASILGWANHPTYQWMEELE